MTDETKLADAPADEPVNLDAPAEVTEAVKEEATTETKIEDDTDVAGDEAGEDGKPKKLSGAARAKIRNAYFQSELQARDRKIEELARQLPAQKSAGDSEEAPPKEGDFNGDFFAFRDATSAFAARQAIREELQKDRKTRQEEETSSRQAEETREIAISFNERVEELKDTIPDIEATFKEATKSGSPFSPYLGQEIAKSDKGPELSYHLIKNPTALQRLNSIANPVELAREMGRLEATVAIPQAKKQTTAPAPLEPLKGGASGSFDPVAASMDDYVAKRKAGWKG